MSRDGAGHEPATGDQQHTHDGEHIGEHALLGSGDVEGRHVGDHHHVDTRTVEEVVRAQLSNALGGKRGMFEAAVPTLTFTLTYVTTREVVLALGLSVSLAVVLLGVRLLQRGNVQYAVNALVGIGIGSLFVYLAGRGGGDEDTQALAYFLPGLIYNAVYGAVMTLSILTRWPVVGFMVGAVADDPFEWRKDPQVVRLCSHLTWLLVVPCVLRLLVQVPMFLAGGAADDAGPWINALGVSKVVMGWPLQIAVLAAMVWVLTRDRMPVASPSEVSDRG